MKTTFDNVPYANIIHDSLNYRSAYEFPPQDELVSIGKSIAKNGIKNLPNVLVLRPAVEQGGAEGQYVVKCGNVSLASIGTLDPAFLADCNIPCRIITGMSDKDWSVFSVNSNRKFDISQWSKAREVARLDKAGVKNKEIATRLALAASEVSTLKGLAMVTEYAEDQELTALSSAINEGRFAPTEYTARLNEFNKGNDKKTGNDRVPWNTFITELNTFIAEQPIDAKLTRKAFSAFKYATPAATTPATETPGANHGTEAGSGSLPSAQLPVGAQAGDQSPVTQVSDAQDVITGNDASNANHGDNEKASFEATTALFITTMMDGLNAIKGAKARNETVRIQLMVTGIDSLISKVNQYRGKLGL